MQVRARSAADRRYGRQHRPYLGPPGSKGERLHPSTEHHRPLLARWFSAGCLLRCVPPRFRAARRNPDGFEGYARRFKGEPRLAGYVFGNGVLENYNNKFSGSPSEFFDLLAEASARLQVLETDNTPLLAVETETYRGCATIPGDFRFGYSIIVV